MYFDELMHVATNAHWEINANTMHKYVDGLATLKTMMCMLANKLDIDAISMYSDAMVARVHFQKYVTIDRADTTMDYQA